MSGYVSGPAETIRSITKGTALVLGPCRGILCGTAGTVNFTTIDGVVLTNVPIQQGYNPIRVKSVEAGGGALDLWALY